MNQIFMPLVIRGHILKNRIAVPPMVVSETDESGYVVESDVEHYRELAAGGAGLVIQEVTAVSPTGKLGERQLGVWEDGQVPGLARIAEAVHQAGSKAVMQIHHAGLISVGVQDAPTDCEYDYRGRICKGAAMTPERAGEIQNQFIQAGRRAFEAGYDGVELHGAHSYLISQLLNPVLNTRADRLGTDPTGWVREIIEGIRAISGDNFLIGIRLGGFEPTLDAGRENILKLAPYVDFFDVSSGFGDADPSVSEQARAENWPYDLRAFAAKKAKEWLTAAGCETLVFAVGGITGPELAEAVLQESGADMADVGRGHLINPNWVNDALCGKDTGKCLQCKRCVFKEGKCPGKKLFEKNNG